MQVSAELRWFWNRAVPPDVERWFRSGGKPPGGGAPRADEYVIDPGQRELGLKKRGGKPGVEIKGLIGAARDHTAGAFAGRPQIWGKWTSDVLTIDDLPRAIVHKVRWLRKFDADREQLIEMELDQEERPRGSTGVLPTHGCQLELASVTVGGHDSQWWTLGFEAFGPLETVEATLRRTLAHLSGTSPPSLGTAQALSYPEWLARRYD